MDKPLTYQYLPFNSPEGIRIIETAPCNKHLQMLIFSTFNSPEGIRIIETRLRGGSPGVAASLSTPLRELGLLRQDYREEEIKSILGFQLP